MTYELVKYDKIVHTDGSNNKEHIYTGLTFAANRRIIDLVKYIPLEDLLLIDSPFILFDMPLLFYSRMNLTSHASNLNPTILTILTIKESNTNSGGVHGFIPT